MVSRTTSTLASTTASAKISAAVPTSASTAASAVVSTAPLNLTSTTASATVSTTVPALKSTTEPVQPPTKAPIVLPDSYGTEFLTMFPWNNGNDTEPPITSMDIINMNEEVATVLIQYPEFEYDNETRSVTRLWLKTTVNVSSKSSYRMLFNNSILPDNSLDSRISISSSVPISVVQHDYMPNGVGDSFTVLPVAAAGTRYSLVLPHAGAGGVGTVYVLGLKEYAFFEVYIYKDNGELVTQYDSVVSFYAFLHVFANATQAATRWACRFDHAFLH
ncbi:unnamed protein product [Gongylonema pulchrum]|uniref:IgGFc_binding domain-containing protein n=1 Tax=Gongylonema pulchrum TaxID=637853 RepID=A0A183CXT7_9BILA|nr:unnamed protein product [Gongylonema pulchrum]